MTSTLNPKDRCENSRLLRDASDTVLQMAEIAYNNEDEGEIKIFYSHLRLHCLLLRDHLDCSQQIFSQLDDQLVNEILVHLGSLVPENNIQEKSSYAATSEFRLRMLNLHWEEARKQTDSTKLEFIRRWLKLMGDESQRENVERGLGVCTTRLASQKVEPTSREPPAKHSSLNVSEPSHIIWRAAQSIFEAFLSCKGCACPSQHDFSAKLELGTYRKHEYETSEKLQSKPTRGRGRKPTRGNNTTSGADLDLFLSMKQNWHQVRIQTAKERSVSFNLPGETASRRDTATLGSQKKVEILCQWINKTKPNNLKCLLLRLHDGELFDMGFEKSNFWVQKDVHPVSLAQCFEKRQECFTEKTKRILSLIMAYTVLHLNGTSWLQSGWGSTNIKFFQTAAHKTPLRPFLQTPLEKVSGDDFDDFDDHKCPVLIALAVVLIEIYFVKPFKKLAEMHKVLLVNEPSSQIASIDVYQVFNGCDEGNKEGCRSQIPEDSLLHQTIDNCLDVSLWEDKNEQPLDDATLRSKIYEHVVQPLEIHLTHGFSQITIENVDKFAREIDFGNWGEMITISELGSQSMHMTTETSSTTPTSASPLCTTAQIGVDYAGHKFQNLTLQSSRNSARILHSNQKGDCVSTIVIDEQVSQFFDDEVLDVNFETPSVQNYKKWRSEYERVYEKFINKHIPGSLIPFPFVKIAILDTGIDRGHDYIEVRQEKLKGTYNCFDESKRAVVDRNGHGTFAACLILDYAPNSGLYVIKVADQNSTPNARVVANAIDYAANVWGVDIISMSFGWPSSDFDGFNELETSIDNAHSKKILIFAAASNSGARLGRAYPASSPHVICVHSTDTYGSASRFSPTARPNALNIATVGESVQSAWPMLLCNQNNLACIENRSGTSYATPIIAGISGFLLEYARLHLPPNAASALKRKENMEAVLKRCAERGRDYKPRDDYYYVELSLEKHNLFGRELEAINYEILDTLKL